jgi:hypothetical protein
MFVFLINDNTLYNKDKENDHFIILGVIQGVYKISGDEISNSNETLKLDGFKQKVQTHLQNPKPKEEVKPED